MGTERHGRTLVVDTQLGRFGVEVTTEGVCRVRLPGGPDVAVMSDDNAGAPIAESAVTQLTEYASGERKEFDLPLDWRGMDATHRTVLETLRVIAPYGHTVTYGELGAAAGVTDPREIGVHMATNPLPIVVPCHRVVAADGIGGYSGGVELKRRLLELEGALPPSLDLGGA